MNDTKYVTQPMIGDVITCLASNNTYTIGPKINEGGFSIVYHCKDVWENELAVKVLKPIGTYEKVKFNAQNEFDKLLQLRNPYITFVYDAFEYRNTFYIVTERCEYPLSNLFQMEGFNGMLWLMSIARILLQAVYYLHINNYAHQDIHPGNIFIAYAKNELIPTSKPSALTYKLGDLGISKTLNEIDAKNTLAQWMLPPEVLNSIEFGPIDHRLDIYHIGLLFLQIAYSKELKFTRQQILDGEPRKMALDLPMPYSLAIEKALRRHVRYRTRSTMEMWRDLQVPTK